MVEVKPKTEGETYTFTYQIKEEPKWISIADNFLTLTPEETGSKTFTVIATYKDHLNVEFSLIVVVTDSTPEPVVPVFEDIDESLDLYYENHKDIKLAPIKAEGYSFSYALKEESSLATIEDSTLHILPLTTGKVELVIIATYDTNKAIEFKVTLNVTNSTPAAPILDSITGTMNLMYNTTLEYSLSPSGASSFQYSYEMKEASDFFEIHENTEINFQNRQNMKLKFSASKEAVYEGTLLIFYSDTKNPNHEFDAVEVSVRITVIYEEPTIKQEEVEKNLDVYTLENKDAFHLDLKENVLNYSDGLTFKVSLDGQEVTVENGSYDFVLGNYDHTITTVEIMVDIYFQDKKVISYTIKLNIKDTTKYRVENGSFNQDLEGWSQSEVQIGYISEDKTFFNEEYPMFNEGKYFSGFGYEGNKGTLSSSYFTVSEVGYITYMLGGAGNRGCYITIEDKAGNILGIYRNTKFTDFTAEENLLSVEERRAMIGETKFLANLVLYKVDLTVHVGQEVRIVLHDEAESGWGLFFFDEVRTYYESEEDITEKAILAKNELADKTELGKVLEEEIAEQGDYTLESYEAYRASYTYAKELMEKELPYLSQEEIDEAILDLTAKKEGLALREVEILKEEDTVLGYRNTDLILSLKNYLNTNALSKITFELSTEGAIILGDIVDGKIILDTKQDSIVTGQAFDVTITCIYDKDGLNKQYEVVLHITISDAIEEPTSIKDEIALSFDLYLEERSIELDLAENLNNPSGVELSYSVNENLLSTSTYLFEYSQTGQTTLNITVEFEYLEEIKTISYIYIITIIDSSDYRLYNGDFETGTLEGWKLAGAELGGVSEDSNYWLNDSESAEGFAFNKDGKYFFSAYTPGALESAIGVLQSSEFTIGGSGFITFKIGAGKNTDQVYIQIVEATTGNILAVFGNTLWQDRTNGAKSGCTMISYKADLTTYQGKTVFIRMIDRATIDYGLFFVDSFVT